MNIEVVLTPAEIGSLPQRDLGGTACVVFDVLRATSTFLVALARGARRIYPVTSAAEALALQARWPQALLGGERGGLRLPGFDLGNSPHEYTTERVSGRDIIATTTNGTVALRACAHAGAVYAGALLNIDALAKRLHRSAPNIERLVLICAGTEAQFALEDGFAAGALLARLPDASVDDAGLALRALYEQGADGPENLLRNSANGRRLGAIGLGADVEFCARIAEVETVAMMRDGALEAS